MHFPFNEPENVAVLTCVHILEDNHDICYVSHDEEDGAWQFLCGKTHDISEGRVVALKEIFDMDSSVGELSSMPFGYEAERDDRFSPWKGFSPQ